MGKMKLMPVISVLVLASASAILANSIQRTESDVAVGRQFSEDPLVNYGVWGFIAGIMNYFVNRAINPVTTTTTTAAATTSSTRRRNKNRNRNKNKKNRKNRKNAESAKEAKLDAIEADVVEAVEAIEAMEESEE